MICAVRFYAITNNPVVFNPSYVATLCLKLKVERTSYNVLPKEKPPQFLLDLIILCASNEDDGQLELYCLHIRWHRKLHGQAFCN